MNSVKKGGLKVGNKLERLGKMFKGIDEINHSSICVIKEAVKQLIPNIDFKLKSDDENVILSFADKTTVIYNCRTKITSELIRFGDIKKKEKTCVKTKKKRKLSKTQKN